MATSQKVAVLGAGHWGTALAEHAAVRGHDVCMWAYEPEVVASVNSEHRNALFLKELELSPRVTATGSLAEAVRDAELVLMVLPAQRMRSYVAAFRDHLSPGVSLVICSKGIEQRSLALLDEVLREELPPSHHDGICVLSGPSFAAEVARFVPTNVTVAARALEVGKRVQAALSTRTLRIYTTDDIIGVQLGGALKNVIAIAVGACAGLGFGHNTRAGLITRGLAELTRLSMSMGGRAETMLGLAGVGDLILTCTGELSRNRQVGIMLAEGKTIAEIERVMRTVAEGVPTAASAHALARRQGVELPIIEQVYHVLYDDKSVTEAMGALQDRALKDEW